MADVIVTFGQLGLRRYHNALWQESWGRSYPLCTECWGTVHQAAVNRRQALVISEATSVPSQFQARQTDTARH